MITHRGEFFPYLTKVMIIDRRKPRCLASYIDRLALFYSRKSLRHRAVESNSKTCAAVLQPRISQTLRRGKSVAWSFIYFVDGPACINYKFINIQYKVFCQCEISFPHHTLVIVRKFFIDWQKYFNGISHTLQKSSHGTFRYFL